MPVKFPPEKIDTLKNVQIMSCKVGPLLIRNGVLGPLSMAKIKWVTGIIITPTLPPITMEVENGVLEDVFSLQIGYFPLP